MLLNRLFYIVKPVIPRRMQIAIRRQSAAKKRIKYRNVWPINPASGSPPDGWSGWPDKKKFALVLTHDIDNASGQKKCLELTEQEKRLGFRSSFNFVSERYQVAREIREALTNSGFEVALHGLYHDGRLYSSRKTFHRRAIRINEYLKNWGAVGFRSPAMHHNLVWLHALNIEYDASTFDTDPFEPQSDGMGTVFPFWVQSENDGGGYVELPYTLPQDYTLFIILKEETIRIWTEKLDWLAERSGMALLNVHPDYMSFDPKKQNSEEYPADYYFQFLEYIKTKYEGQYWNVLPREMARFWKSHYKVSTSYTTPDQKSFKIRQDKQPT